MPIHHLGFKVPNFDKTREFYLAALKPLGYRVTMSKEDGKVLGLGAGLYAADFWLVDPAVGSKTEETDEEKASKYSQLLHIAFSASNRAQVREFYKAAIAAGGKCNGPPGVREKYFPTYYAAFVLDPDGRNIEVVCLKPEFWAEPWGLVGWGTVGVVILAIGGGMVKWVGMV